MTTDPRHAHDHDHDPTTTREAVGAHAVDAPAGTRRAAPRDVALEEERFGGMKFGSAFFGWLTATGMAVLLTALLAATGAAVGLATDTSVDQAAGGATSNPQTVGIVGLVVLAVVVFVSYYCGGYVAGRMARFDGTRQGLAVWLWALLIAVLVAVLGAVAGDEFNVLGRLNGFPRLPVGEGELTTVGLLTAAAVAVTSLVGALLGGKAGMHFHRKVDRTALDA